MASKGNVRRIAKVWKSEPTIEGAGVHLKRAFGFQEVPQLDPFLLMDDFHNKDQRNFLPGFPWHPHRGIETITYLLDGEVDHGDSLGNSGVIAPGDVQWMTAGSGIIHQEMPRPGRDGGNWGFQLWANLPRSHKMMDPRYRGLTAGDIPQADLGAGVKAKVICGEIGGVQGPTRDIVTDPEYFDVTVPVGAGFRHSVKSGHTAFAYVVAGRGYFDAQRDPFAYQEVPPQWLAVTRDCQFGPETLVLYERTGDEIAIDATDTALRFLLVTGRPIGEPVAWYGPIVMNTQEQLRQAFEDLDRGTFLKGKTQSARPGSE
jgi:redox-sensitive bicupin YhaK (pirin superfamily)